MFCRRTTSVAAVGGKFSGSLCVHGRGRRVVRHVSRFGNGLCLRFNNGLFSSCRTTHMLPNFRPSTGVHLLHSVTSRTRVVFYVDTNGVRGGGLHTSLNVDCSRSLVQRVDVMHDVNVRMGDIIVAHCANRTTTSRFGRGLSTLNVAGCFRRPVTNCPTSISRVIDSRNCNTGPCVRAAGPLIIIATPNPNDNGLTAYLSRMCRRGHHNVLTNCNGCRAFPV